MDALALLCTLHAEGPRTLRLLREAGCRDVRDFLALDPEVVSALLDIAPAVARRLSREGQHLAQRVGSEFLESEDDQAAAHGATAMPVHGMPMPPGPSGPHGPSSGDPAPMALPTDSAHPADVGRVVHAAKELKESPVASSAASEARVPVDAYLNGSERQILDKVLKRWRENDGDTTVDAVHVSAAPGTRPTTPIEVHQPRVEPLEIAGVPQANLIALRAAGFVTPEAVESANAMALANAVGCSFGDARRFQFLASRALKAGRPDPPEVPASPPSPELPANPGGPEVPSSPGGPEVPSNPGGPELPSNPGGPELPSSPGGPKVPGNPPKNENGEDADLEVREHLIERPAAAALGTSKPARPASSPVSALRPSEPEVRAQPVGVASAPGQNGARVHNGTKTVLNWDFVAPSPAESVEGPDGDALPGGPFA